MKHSWLASLLALVVPVRAAEPAPGWLCVGSREFLSAAAPLAELRRSQGLEVTMAGGPVAKALAKCPVPPAFIVILGDEVRGSGQEGAGVWRVPADRRPYHGWKASHPQQFVSDMSLGDLDGDGVPEVPVGRIPARTTGEVAAAVTKILSWEQRTPAISDLSVPVWAGDPGFADMFRDAALGFLFSQVQRRAPLWAELWVLQGDDRSPFCGWPADQQRLFNGRLQGGGLLSAMIGHGRPAGWWSMDLAGSRLEYSVADAALLAGTSVAPPHVIFACACGNFAWKGGDCLVEALFRAPGGPVVCVGASEDSHPLTNYYHSTALLSSLTEASPRFGDLWLKSLRQANATTEPDKELLVRALEPVLIHKSLRTADLRADHAMLYNIIGDPATRVFAPVPLTAEITEKDGQWHWKVAAPPRDARLLVQRREPVADFPLGTAAASPGEAGLRMEAANDQLRFRTVEEKSAGAEWSGVTAGPGTLRLVAVGGKAIGVAAATMAVPGPVVPRPAVK